MLITGSMSIHVLLGLFRTKEEGHLYSHKTNNYECLNATKE